MIRFKEFITEADSTTVAAHFYKEGWKDVPDYILIDTRTGKKGIILQKGKLFKFIKPSGFSTTSHLVKDNPEGTRVQKIRKASKPAVDIEQFANHMNKWLKQNYSPAADVGKEARKYLTNLGIRGPSQERYLNQVAKAIGKSKFRNYKNFEDMLRQLENDFYTE